MKRRKITMKKVITLEWLIAAGIRAIKTVAQTALAMFTLGMAFSEINWTYVISVSVVAGIYSLLTSVVGLPEVGTDGTLQIDTTNPEKDTYRFAFNSELTELAGKKKVIFNVDTSAKL
jgi:hypothetical protein